jgi:hypothetical protein
MTVRDQCSSAAQFVHCHNRLFNLTTEMPICSQIVAQFVFMFKEPANVKGMSGSTWSSAFRQVFKYSVMKIDQMRRSSLFDQIYLEKLTRVPSVQFSH